MMEWCGRPEFPEIVDMFSPSRDSEPLNIVVAGSEAFPFAKTGGLGDVLGALPDALTRLGHKPVVMIPAYREIRRCGRPIEDTGLRFSVPIGNKSVAGGLLRGTLPGADTPIYFIRQDEYFDRPGLYAENNQGYVDNCERFTFFSRAVLEACRALELPVDVMHCNDWHTGLLPVYLKTEYRAVPRFQRTISLMTIHNMEHQGEFWHWDMTLTGLDWGYFNWRQMEAYGKLNLLKSGLVFADAINAVSPRYAEEIQTPDFGCRLEGVLSSRRDDLAGIINGVDYDVWNPSRDKFLPMSYGPTKVREGKAAAKAALQQQLGLEVRQNVPLVGFIGRLVSQKGVDLILDVLREWVRKQDVQWAFLGGDGDPRLGDELAKLAAANPQRVAARIEKSEELAHRIEAASDLFLMPSRFEPCGLNQLYSLKYGTVPVVHAVGGLANTVVDASPENIRACSATGFSFQGAHASRFEEVLLRACDVYRNQPQVWADIQRTGMSQDWSWDRSARDYVDLYRRTIAKAMHGEAATV
jgi:starch synthase